VHLQAYILQSLEQLTMFQGDQIEWIGNEVACGVGMQRIDILLSVIRRSQRFCIPIELKAIEAPLGITNQVRRYVDWLNQYYIPNLNSIVEPMIIAKKIDQTKTQHVKNLFNEFRNFNAKSGCSKLRYIEFEFNRTHSTIDFQEMTY
jgi:hypothetical protein